MVGKLNYSKWDNLELSDDSDIEVHPNVDKKSFVRWKQRDIHEKREVRKAELDGFKREKDLNEELAPRLDEVSLLCSTQEGVNMSLLAVQILEGARKEGSSYYSREVSRLTADRASRGNKDGPNGPTTNDMILSLLLQINDEPSVKGKSSSDLDEALVAKLQEHQTKLAERQTEVASKISEMEEEDRRKITSDSLREGWSGGHVTKAEPEPAPAPKPATTANKGKGKMTEQKIETLNASSLSPDSDAEDDDDDESVPTMTPSMRDFLSLPPVIPSSLPLSLSSLPANFNPSRDVKNEPFEQALQFLSKNKSLLREDSGTTDALLVEAFQAAMRSDAKRARSCVEKGLLVQYCNKLGKDGVSLFFRRMTSTDGKAAVVFFNDVLSTHARIMERSKVLLAEQSQQPSSGEGGKAGEEQIQLVAEDPSTVISFEVPDGPPPEHLTLEGEGVESMDVEQVRVFLQRRWDIYQGFSDDFRQALETKQLDRVNEVLGKMNVEEAEKVVGLLDEAGILSFSSKEVRDETGK